jgi:hypothetical protein
MRADTLQVVTGLILGPVTYEFSFQGPFLKLGQASARDVGILRINVDYRLIRHYMWFPLIPHHPTT